jgi:DNA (cytosine-5)-methyltransferase 1
MNRQRLYTTKEVVRKVGVSRATLYNWFRNKKVRDVARDRNNFRIFTEADIRRIAKYKNIIRFP